MYIFEIIAKLIKNHRLKKNSSGISSSEENDENCSHVYLAIDSTKDYLACNKCGHVIKNR